MNPGLMLLLVFLVLCSLQIPVAIALFLSSVSTALVTDIPLVVMSQQFWRGLDSFTLLAIPLFLLAGAFMDSGGIVDRIAKFADTLVGHIKGSLGHVIIVCGMLLASVSGSATAIAVATGSMFIPAMKKAGYPDKLAAAINAAAATMGPIIPPSIIMVVYASSAGISTGALFLAGVTPGVLIGLLQMATVYNIARKKNIGVMHTRSSIKMITRDFISCSPALLVPVFIIGGIVAGFFTATEAAMIAVVYCLILSVFFYKTIKVNDFYSIFKKSALASAPCLFCIGAAGVFGWLLAYLNIPDMILKAMAPFISGPASVLILLSIIFIFIGMIMDALPAIIIFQPIVSAMSAAGGCEPLHVAIIVSLVLCFGLMTPPYGITLLLSSQLANVRSLAVAKMLLPLYFAFLIIVLLIIFFPEAALFLPRFFMPQAFN